MGYATPMPYVYFLLILPSNTPRWLYVLLGFLLGVLIDIFGNTPGMAAATMTAIGLITPLLFNLFGPRQRRQHLTFNENYGALALRPLPPNSCFPAVRHLLLYRIFQLLQLDFSAYQYRWFNSTDYAVLHRLGADKKKALMTHTII